MKVFIIDVAKCNGCHNCQVVCKDEHVGNDWGKIAKPQPDTGHFWIEVKQQTHGQTPKVCVEYNPVMCMHCDDAPCVKAGGGAVYKREDGIVIIDPEKSVNKKELVKSCPFGKIYWNEELFIAQKCTGCSHLVDEGKKPRCVDSCMTDAMIYGEEEDLKDLIAQAEQLYPEKNVKTRVYYLNLPKLFIAGTIYDPDENDVVEKAKVTLKHHETGLYKTEMTDSFGDFWFKKIAAGTYDVTIEMYGYQKIVKKNIKLDKSLNIGDLPMKKA